MQLSYFSSKEKSIIGKIKQNAPDFIVEEIMPDGTVLELNKKIERKNDDGKFVHLILQKENLSTIEAVRKIASGLHISPKRINYAGNKDKKAITVQLISIFGANKEEVLKLELTGIKILGAWYSDKKVNLGSLLGNRFKINVEGLINEKILDEIVSELAENNNKIFPNYFGPQRFGSVRANTHLIGEMLLRNDVRSAVEIFLMDEKEVDRYANEARKQLQEEKNYKKALDYFPKYLKLERIVLSHLAEHPYDYANALRKLPRQILLLFIHAFQSYLFNLSLSERLNNGELALEKGEYYCGEKLKFPDLNRKTKKGWLVGKIIGYETELNEREIGILEELELKKEDFKIKNLPEISSKGAYRTLLAPMKDFEYRKNTFVFSLPSGSYATSALREFIKDLW